MANQAIALQARAPQSAGLGPAIAQNAQAINMMAQQRAAERQAAQAQQTMDIEAAKEMRAAALAAPQMKKAEAEAGAAQVKYVMDFMDASALAIANVRDPQQAMAVGQRLKQLFVEPEFQQAVDETLGSIPQDPGQFEAWREDSLFRTLEAKDQLAQEFETLSTGREQFMVGISKNKPGARAVEVPGTRVQAAEGLQYIKDDQGNVFAVPKTAAGTGGFGAGGGTFERMLRVESGGKQFDRSGRPLTSSAGAIGIAQVMPKTAPEAARLAGLPFDDNRYRNDPEYNRALGEAYFEKQLADFGDERLAAAAYNAGPGAVRRALQKGGPDGWINHVPAETQNYVQSVFGGRGAAGAGAGPTPVIKGSNTKANEALTAMEAAKARYDETIEVAKRLLNNPDLDTILGNIQGNIPETALSLYSQGAANALADYNTLLTTAGFQELQAMRDASPTGGALGQVAVEENKMLQKSAFSSSRTQAEAKFKQAVRDYISRLERSRSRVVGAYERQFGERLPSSAGAATKAAPKTKTRLRYNPATGDFE